MAASERIPDPRSAEFAPYAGRWVAWLSGRVVAQGGTPRQTLQAAKAARHKENPAIFFIPMMNTFEFPPLLKSLRAALPALHSGA